MNGADNSFLVFIPCFYYLEESTVDHKLERWFLFSPLTCGFKLK